MKQTITFLFAMCVSSVSAMAQSFTFNGLEYTVIDATNHTCAVTGVEGDVATNLIIPSTAERQGVQYNVVSIGDQAFFYETDIVSVTMPNTVTSIGEAAFCWCTSLSEIKFGSATVTIGETAFNTCSSLTKVDLPEALMTIGENAFASCKLLSDVMIPASVVEIGDNAFGTCPSLSNINVAKDNKVYSSVDGVLLSADMKKLLLYPCGKPDKNYTIPEGVEELRIYALGECKAIENVTFASTVKTVCEGAFYECENLKSVKLNEGLVELGRYAFAGDISLQSIDIPNSVTTMDEGVFMSCESLGTVAISNNVTSLGQFVFYSCEPLTKITLPAKLESIGQYCFDGTSLTDVTSLSQNPPVCSASAFSATTYSNATLTVPANSATLYREANTWKQFANIKESQNSGVDAALSADVTVEFAHGCITVAGYDGCISIYNAAGVCVYAGADATVSGLTEGIYIVHAGDKTFKGAL